MTKHRAKSKKISDILTLQTIRYSLNIFWTSAFCLEVSKELI